MANFNIAVPENVNSGTFLGETGRRVVDRLVDTRRLGGATPTEKQYFTAAQNTAVDGQTLTVGDTNMTTDRVPANEKWYLWGLGTSYGSFDGTAVSAAMAGGTLTWLSQAQIIFSIETQEVWRMPAAALFGPLAYGQLTSTAALAPVYIPENRAEPGEIVFNDASGPVPIVLEANTAFRLSLSGPAWPSGLEIDLSFYFHRTKIVLAAS